MGLACGVYEDEDTPALLAQMRGARRALFLDRDGVINVDHGYVHRSEDTQWVPGIFDACRVAIEAGCLVIVVTNQAGIARGYYNEETFREYTRWVHEQFKCRGVVLHATCFCPHHPEALDPSCRQCDCRKPAPGMIVEAARRYNIALGESAMLGDKPWDVQAGRSAGVGLNLRFAPDASPAPDVVATVGEAAQIIRSYFESCAGGADAEA